MAALNVVCLISGGKDSLFSILHCLKNGHRVVALANLHPASNSDGDAVEDMDSYMYQTVGHGVIPLYAEALGLPLYRHEVHGSAVNQDKCYGASGEDDEAEALVPLLRKVAAQHPDMNAVSTGAILSDYQRTRVESVAIRLGLVPLSFLWQWPNLRPHTPDALLKDMAAIGQDARIIKVASGGLDESMLWQNVADPRTIGRLGRAVQRFGSNDDGAVLGEGGEYETLAIAGPSPLWKRRIVIEEEHRIVVPGDAGSASLLVVKARLDGHASSDVDIAALSVPRLLEPAFQAMLESLQHHSLQATQPLPSTADVVPALDTLQHPEPAAGASLLPSSSHILLSDLLGDGVSAADQMANIMRRVEHTLSRNGCGFADVLYTSIVLREMNDFAAINAVYGRYFTRPNPPARATLACEAVLPNGVLVTLSLTYLPKSASRRLHGLHVQSRSYWAPANIGPYSQAIASSISDDVDAVYIAGQIPLVPASMQLPVTNDGRSSAFNRQIVLALQHADRVGRAMQLQTLLHGIAFIVASSRAEAQQRSSQVRLAWSAYCEAPDGAAEDSIDDDDDSFDVWHSAYGSRPSVSKQAAPNRPQLASRASSLHVIRVDALPRGADIEWVTFGLTTHGNSRCSLLHHAHLIHLFKSCSVA